MNSERGFHTATLLLNGKVLAVGGMVRLGFYDQCNWNLNTIGTAELYDPSTGTWEATSSLSNIRHAHTATLIPNGKVLVIGGRNYFDSCGIDWYDDSIATVEMFDPINETWESSETLNISRGNHTAIMLVNDSVLVLGGIYVHATWKPYVWTTYNLSSAELLVLPIPVANAGPDQSFNTLAEVTLDGSASSDIPLTYQWTQTGGSAVHLNNPTTVTPSFTAPDDPTELTFSLVVTNSSEFSSEVDVVTITVDNQAPISNAGPDQSVYTLTTVTLDGSGSNDPDGDLPLTYIWEQTGGPTVSLLNSNLITSSFISPNVQGVLTFSLVVTDSKEGQSYADEVVIMVNPYKIFLPLMSR